MVCNTGVYLRFLAVALLYTCFYAGACKNETALIKPASIVEHKRQEECHTTPVALDQNDAITTSTSSYKTLISDAIQMENNLQHKNSNNHPKPTDQAPPKFTLKPITITADTPQPIPIVLETTGSTKGYSIKSVVVIQEEKNKKKPRYYTNKFGLNNKDKPKLLSDGLPSLTVDPKLKAGDYKLRIQTEPSSKEPIEGIIHIIKEETKNKNENESSSVDETTQTLNGEELVQNNCPTNNKKKTSKKKKPRKKLEKK